MQHSAKDEKHLKRNKEGVRKADRVKTFDFAGRQVINVNYCIGRTSGKSENLCDFDVKATQKIKRQWEATSYNKGSGASECLQKHATYILYMYTTSTILHINK